MPQPDTQPDVSAIIAKHQANLARLSEAWGQDAVDELDSTDRATISRLKKMLNQVKFQRNTAQGIKTLEYIRTEIEKIRAAAYRRAERKLRERSMELIDNEEKWAKRLILLMLGVGLTGVLFSELEKKRILKAAILQSQTWEQWWLGAADRDIERITNAINAGINQGLSEEQIIEQLVGTDSDAFSSGILSKNRESMRSTAGSLCSDLANVAKDALYRKHKSECGMVEWVSTLDGKVCRGCASLSGKRWKTDTPHTVPKLHPHCRCLLVAVAPNSPPVAGMKFQTYFEKYMTTGEQRSWLGAERYKLYLKGWRFSDFIAPWPDRSVTVAELKRLDIASFSPAG